MGLRGRGEPRFITKDTKKDTKDTPREVGPATIDSTGSGLASGGPTIRSAELDELTRAFADRYVGLLASARDALKKDNPDVVQCREAQDLLVDGATNVYDIATNADSFTRVLDLIVVTTLVSQVWIDDDRATEVFGDRAEMLIRALHHGRVETWALAAQVLRPDQLDLLDYLLWDWRRHNPDMVRAYSVRFSNFATGRGKSADAEVLAAGGLFGNVGQAGQAIEETRLLTERMFYQLKRGPALLRWHAEALQDTTLATPGVGGAVADIRRLTDQVEQLPKNIAAERQALLAALDERMDRADATVDKVKATINEANQFVTALGPASESLRKTFETADALFARYDSWYRLIPPAGSRIYDIRDYIEFMKELALTSDKVNDALKSSNELLGSSEWDRRVQQVNESADERVKRAVGQSQQVVNNFFGQAYAGLVVLFVILIICLATAFVLMRRLIKRVAGNAAGLRSERDHAVGHKSGPGVNAGGAGREGVSG
ncbi:MAG: hypothetical protein RDV41_13225 [Planctomycetota bacterium]|nr:hypothetical protein [Planctomycetota bacterium]